MTPDVVGTCACGVQIVAHHRIWNRLAPDERAELRTLGYERGERTGECHPCGAKRRRAAYRAENPISFRRRADVLEDWAFLVDHTKSLRANIHINAPRMGMTVTALEKALDRAGVKAWPATPAPRGWTPQAEAS